MSRWQSLQVRMAALHCNGLLHLTQVSISKQHRQHKASQKPLQSQRGAGDSTNKRAGLLT